MFEGSLTTYLLADASLAAHVADRIRPIEAAQGEARPYLAYYITDRADPSPSHDGPSGVIRVTYDLLIVGDTNRAVAEISAIVRRIMPAHFGINNSVDIWGTTFEGESDIEQQRQPGEEKATYVRQQTFVAVYQEQSS